MYDWAELRHFRYLLAILENQGVRTAADTLFTAQSNLSRQAKEFQENASILLYRKTKSGRIRPTPTGQAFVALAKFLLETKDEVIDALIAIDRGELRSLRLGCCPWVDSNLLQRLIGLHREIAATCSIRPMFGNTAKLIEEVATGQIDAAFVTLPSDHPDLIFEDIRKDRLVACIRKDCGLAIKQTLSLADLHQHPPILYRPEHHSEAHNSLLTLLVDQGISVNESSRATTPSEMLHLVREGYGIAFARDGLMLDTELTTRPLNDVNWVVTTSFIYRKEGCPKSIPLVLKMLRHSLGGSSTTTQTIPLASVDSFRRRPPQSAKQLPKQSHLFHTNP